MEPEVANEVLTDGNAIEAEVRGRSASDRDEGQARSPLGNIPPVATEAALLCKLGAARQTRRLTLTKKQSLIMFRTVSCVSCPAGLAWIEKHVYTAAHDQTQFGEEYVHPRLTAHCKRRLAPTLTAQRAAFV